MNYDEFACHMLASGWDLEKIERHWIMSIYDAETSEFEDSFDCYIGG